MLWPKSNVLPIAVRRRVMFFALCLIWPAVTIVPMAMVLGQHGWTIPEVIIFALFIILMGQISFGFTLALIGYFVLRKGGDSALITKTLSPNARIGQLPATAIVMPIFNEDVGRVFQGLQVMFHSLEKTGRSSSFDFFILSDSDDPNYWIAEEMAWLGLSCQTKGFGRIFYRNRRNARHHKSGNIADFCRRWGANYRYAIVLDADSIMTGKAFVRLVALMEKNPTAGIIQTLPHSVLGKSLFQRIMQFGGRIYGPMFMAGASYLHHGTSLYWGHNAIIRLKPFIKHCAMPELPKTEALGRRILSHDTIEAALMRAAGYGVWFTYDIGGSYEEGPPHLLASLKRDRRWCRGNIQHIWFLFARGIRAASRLHILVGIMAYAGSLLWLLMLLFGTWTVIVGLDAGSKRAQLAGLSLFAYVMFLLLLPKLLGVALLFQRSNRVKAFGGRASVIFSALGETLFSFFLAPILMLFHSLFVLLAFGKPIKWGGQKRVSEVPTWRDCIYAHGLNTLFVVAWAALVAWLAPRHLLWLWPVFLGPLIAVPFTRFTAMEFGTKKAKRKRWFTIPEETDPPPELQEIAHSFEFQPDEFFRSKQYAADFGLLQALLDPYVNALHVSLLRQRDQVATRTQEYMNALGNKLLHHGPAALTRQEKNTLLWDANSVWELHRRLWRSPGPELNEWWQRAFRHYNESIPPTI